MKTVQSFIDQISEDIQALQSDLRSINPKLSIYKDILNKIDVLQIRLNKLKLIRDNDIR